MLNYIKFYKMKINKKTIYNKREYTKIISCIAIIFVFLLMAPVLSSAVQTLGTFKQKECINLIQICSNCTYNNISSVLYPNSTNALGGEVAMTKNGIEYTYQFCNTSDLGQYIVNGHGDIDGVDTVWAYDFYITPSGFSFSESQGISSFALLISIILISGLFMFVSYKFLDTNKTFPIGLFFLVISLLLSVYALHLGYIYTRDIIYPISAEGVQFKVYFGVMWGLIAVIFIAMIFLILKVLKEIRERKSLIRYGEGWNPKTKQYEY